MTRDASRWSVADLAPTDRSMWERLYRSYAEFYETAMPRDTLDLVWNWLHDPAHELNCIVVLRADEPDGEIHGLAHYRPFARPLHGSTGCYLDDLFVSPDARGTGAVDALLAELRQRATRNGWDIVRWITAQDNDRARAAYDRVADATRFVTYDMATR